MNEQWKPIPGYEGYYEVSDQGRVRSLDRMVKHKSGGLRRFPGKLLRTRSQGNDYLSVSLNKLGNAKTRLIHHLVLESFVGPRPTNYVGCHGDGDVSNNHLKNLKWATQSENMGRDANLHNNYSSQYNGVSWDTNCWRTSIQVSGKTVHLGGFKCELEAAKAFDKYVIHNKLNRYTNFAKAPSS